MGISSEEDITTENSNLNIYNSKGEGKEPVDGSSNLNAVAADADVAAADDDINNANPHPKYENSSEDLDGIRQEYSPAEYNNLDEYVNTYNSTTDKTRLIILETHRVNNNDDNLNAKLQFEYENSTVDLNGIQCEYSIVTKV